MAADQWLFQRFSISAAFLACFWAFAGLISGYSGDQGESLFPLPLLLMVFLPAERFCVYVWSGISAGWLPASGLRDRASAERFASLLRKVRGAEHVYKVELA